MPEMLVLGCGPARKCVELHGKNEKNAVTGIDLHLFRHLQEARVLTKGDPLHETEIGRKILKKYDEMKEGAENGEEIEIRVGERMGLLQGDAVKWAIMNREQKFDEIHADSFLHILRKNGGESQLKMFLQQIHGMLAPNGTFHVTTPDKSNEQMLELLKEKGFKLETRETMGAGEAAKTRFKLRKKQEFEQVA